jgi:ATP-dependent DNA helicase RecQ
MHDQIRSASGFGIRAAALTSADDNREETVARLRRGELDLIYVAPERASGEGFRNLIASIPLSLVAIDEAHCVSEWGHDFRPDYRLLRPLLDRFPEVPRLALTATADRTTRADILTQLGIPEDGLIVAGFDRPNIRYHVRPRDGIGKQIAALLAEQPGPGIVYATSRAATEKLAEQLGGNGRRVLPYHAGLEPQVRARNQAAFVGSEDMVMVATVAFGMGIDKPGRALRRPCRHPQVDRGLLPGNRPRRPGRRSGRGASVLGRGGFLPRPAADRDGGAGGPPGGRAPAAERLAAMIETSSCRRALLLRHFGDDPANGCGNCDNCLAPPSTVDATEAARKLLSAAFRTEMRFGISHLTEVLAGNDSEKIRSFGHHRLVGVRHRRCRRARADAAGGARADGARRAAGGRIWRLVLRAERETAAEGRRAARTCPAAQTRPQVAPRAGGQSRGRSAVRGPARLPPRSGQAGRACRLMSSFHDSTLREVAQLRPESLSALARVPGVGQAKLERYGAAFVEVVRSFG